MKVGVLQFFGWLDRDIRAQPVALQTSALRHAEGLRADRADQPAGHRARRAQGFAGGRSAGVHSLCQGEPDEEAVRLRRRRRRERRGSPAGSANPAPRHPELPGRKELLRFRSDRAAMPARAWSAPVVSRAVLIRNPSATERARGIDLLIAEKGQPIVFQSSSGNSPAGNVFRSSTLAGECPPDGRYREQSGH